MILVLGKESFLAPLTVVVLVDADEVPLGWEEYGERAGEVCGRATALGGLEG